jgi:hypothetical protein
MMGWRIEKEIEIAKGLIRMRRAGYFAAVFIDASRISLQMPGDYDLRRAVSWSEAARIVEEFERRKRKPAGKTNIPIRKDARFK